MPHLLFSGAPGTGKTTLAKVLLNMLEVDDMDVLEINASNENNVDTIRNKITNFASTMPFGDMKYVLLDEADYITPNGQAALRGVMEMYHTSCRFILTCNYPTRIIPALHSRCQGFHIEKLDVTEFTARIATIGISEGVDLDLETLDTYVQATYPDLRKCINLVQQNVVDGVLKAPQAGEGSTSEWMLSAIELFKKGDYKPAREMIVSQARPEEYDDVFRFMYRNLELWGDSPAQQDQALLIIRDGMVKSVSCADPEINLSATLVELQINAS
jgi:replication factor C small subunit